MGSESVAGHGPQAIAASSATIREQTVVNTVNGYAQVSLT